MSLTILSEPNELDEKFRDCCRRYSRLDVAVAWCGNPAHTLPYGYLGTFRGQIHATVGISFNRTHPDAIAWLMQQDRVHLRVFRDDKELFHPKVYLFSRGDAYALIVGSSNLTFSGFYGNVEVNAYVTGKFSDALPGIVRLRERLSEWRTDASSLVPSNRWLSSYRKRYVVTLKKARRSSLKTEPQAEEEIATASWLGQADWNVYYSKVLAGLKHYEEREEGIRTALDAGVRLLARPWRTTYFLDPEKRRVINGIGDYAALGHVGASGAFQHLIKNGRAKQHATIVRSMNTIAGLSNPIPWRRLQGTLNDLVRLGPTMKVWGRLLCLVRPDLFCTVSSPSVRANLSKVLEVPQGDVPPAVEIQRRLGRRLRDLSLLLSDAQTELAITRTKRGDQHRHVSISFHPAEAFHGFEHARSDPPQHHLPTAPALDVALHVTRATEQTLRGVGGG